MTRRTLLATVIAGLLALAPVARADVLADVKAAGTLKVGTETEFAPFDYIDAGEHVGFNVDLFAEIGKEMGVKIAWVALPWDGVLPGAGIRQIRHGRGPGDHHQGQTAALCLLHPDRGGNRGAGQAGQRQGPGEAGRHRRQVGRRRSRLQPIGAG